MLAVPLGGRDRDDAERQQRVLFAQAGHHHALRRLLDRRRAVPVLDRDGERAGLNAGRGVRGGGARALVVGAAGGQEQGGEEGEREQSGAHS
jgi:hypothetical protein